MSFELVHKPTFTNQLLAIPKERVVQVLEKTKVLTEDPTPHGTLKKKLHGYSGNVYRLRSGDYRVLYTYGDGWVTLLGVDDRKDIYKGEKLLAQEPDVPVSSIPDVEVILTAAPSPGGHEDSRSTRLRDTEDSAFEITRDLLESLRVPDQYVTTLQGCQTLDDLLEADVPDAVRDRVFDAVYTPDYEKVLEQPDFQTGDVSDLLRFREGELMGFLLKLDPE